MPAMIQSKYGKKILYSVLGKPESVQDKKSAVQKKIEKVMLQQATRLSR